MTVKVQVWVSVAAADPEAAAGAVTLVDRAGGRVY